MTVATQSVNRAPRPSSLADVLEVVLDKGIVIDAYVRVAVVGIELLTIDARVVIASVDTYLRFAEAVNRLDLQPDKQVSGVPGMMDEIAESGSASKTKGALTGAADKAKDAMASITDDEQEPEERPRRRPAKEGTERRSRAASSRSGPSRSPATRRRRSES